MTRDELIAALQAIPENLPVIMSPNGYDVYAYPPVDAAECELMNLVTVNICPFKASPPEWTHEYYSGNWFHGQEHEVVSAIVLK